MVGLLPGEDRGAANQWVQIALPTGLGELRNGLIVRAADAAVAVGGAYGTLSEIALALVAGKPVIGIGTWEIDGVEAAELTGGGGRPRAGAGGRARRPASRDRT